MWSRILRPNSHSFKNFIRKTKGGKRWLLQKKYSVLFKGTISYLKQKGLRITTLNVRLSLNFEQISGQYSGTFRTMSNIYDRAFL